MRRLNHTQQCNNLDCALRWPTNWESAMTIPHGSKVQFERRSINEVAVVVDPAKLENPPFYLRQSSRFGRVTPLERRRFSVENFENLACEQ